MTLWGGNFTTEATWAEADFESFEANEIQTFNSKLKLAPIDTRNIQLQVVAETTRPCTSPISQRITETIGSCKLPDIAKYFQRIGDHSISYKLYKSYSEHKDRQQKFEFLQLLFMPITIVAFAAIFHRIANIKRIASFEVSKAAHSYYWGTMLFVATAFITIYFPSQG